MKKPARFLLVAPAMIAHANPLASIAAELVARGHTVAFTSYSGVERLFPASVQYFAMPSSEASMRAMSLNINDGTRSLPAAFRLHWQDVDLPLCRDMLPHIEAAIERFSPDVMLVDEVAYAGALAARRHGIVWATASSGGDALFDYSAYWASEFTQGLLWLKGLLDELQSSVGLKPVDRPAISPHLVLSQTTRDFAGKERSFPGQYRFVGVCIKARHDAPPFPWEQLDPAMKLVYVSLGSLVGTRGNRFLHVLVDALKDEPIQVVLSDPTGLIQSPPGNFLVRQWVPQVELLRRADLFVTHGGSSVYESLLFGVPMVVAPHHLDNFVFAQKIVEQGVGRRVRFGRPSTTEIRDAVLAVLNGPAYGLAAERFQRSFEAAGGTDAAADELEKLIPG